jgi:hypothetical protein
VNNSLTPDRLEHLTIEKIDASSINTWKISFTDGTVVWIDTERGPLGIPALILYAEDNGAV